MGERGTQGNEEHGGTRNTGERGTWGNEEHGGTRTAGNGAAKRVSSSLVRGVRVSGSGRGAKREGVYLRNV